MTQFNVICLILLVLSGHSLIFSHPVIAQISAQNCPPQPFIKQAEQVILHGEGQSPLKSRDEAIAQLGNYIGNGKIESQYLQRQGQQKQTVETYSSVTSSGEFDASELMQKTLFCKSGQYITYLLYDPRSLEERLNLLVDNKTVRFTGEAYLLQSPVIQNIHLNQQHNPIQEVPLSLLWHTSGFRLVTGQRYLPLNEKNIQRLLLGKQGVQKPKGPRLILSSDTLRAFEQITVKIDKPTSKPQGILACQWTAKCQLLGRSFTPHKTYRLNAPLGRMDSTQLVLFTLDANHPSVLNQTTWTGADMIALFKAHQLHPNNIGIRHVNIVGNFQSTF